MVVALAALAPLAFALVTHHAWEDYFITLRSSRNLVEGHGLVFNPSERVHTFTSPLGVLVPALCTWLAGPGHEEAALWIFRLLNAGVLAGAAALLWRRAESLALGAVGRVVLFGLLFLDAKLVDFSINGMETAILVFFVVLLWSELEAPAGPRATSIGLAIGGLMWTRPDAFIIGAALVGARVLIRNRSRGSAPVPWSPVLRGLLVGGLLYLPWFAWAWWYYGTPVPHTVIAKAAYTPRVDFAHLAATPWLTLLGRSMLVDLFLPAYWNFGGWPEFLKHLAHVLSGVAVFACAFPGISIPARRASFAVFCGMFYVCSILLFPWYVPPWTALAVIVLAFVLDDLHRATVALGRPHVARIFRTTVVGLVVLQGATLAGVAWQMRTEQALVETGVRRQIGEWLRENAGRDDTVFLEPLGYIGYYSQLRTHDIPGLSSPAVVAVVRQGARRYADIIARLQPQWVVLRPSEAARSEFPATGVLQDYILVKSWDALSQLDQIRILPGRAWVEGEAKFLLFRRRAESPRSL